MRNEQARTVTTRVNTAPRRPLLWVLALCVAGLALGSSVASAQRRAGAAADEAPPEGYQELLKTALTETQAENWPEARALLERAHAMYPNARTLRGLGFVAFSARRYVEALRHLRAALEHPVRPLTSAQRSEVTDLITRSEAFTARVVLNISVPDAAVTVDGHQVEPQEDGTFLIDPGEHELVATADEYKELARRFVASGGERVTLQIDLQVITPIAQEPQAQPAAPAIAAEDDAASGETDSAHGRRLWTWVAGGVAVAAGAVGLVSYLSGNADSNAIAKQCGAMPGGGCTREQRDALVDDSSIGTKEAISTIGLVTALAAGAGAVVLFFVEAPSDDQRSSGASVSVAATPGGLALRGQF